MRPHFNSHLCNPNNQLQLNGANSPAPQQQVMANQGNLGQIRPQFPLGMLNNPQLAMPPFTSPNAFFPPNQFFPFPQGTFPNMALNNMPQLLANNAVNPSQFLPNGGQLNMQNLVQNVAQLLQMQMMNCGPQNLGHFVNLSSGGGNNNGVVPQSINGNVMQHMNHKAPVLQDNGSHKAQQNDNMLSPGASNSQNNPGVANGVNNRNNNWRKPHNNNFTGNNRSGNRQFHHQQNAQGNFNFNNENQGKGNKNIGMKNLNASNHSEHIQVGQKRSFIPNYPEKEVQQWREERKRNFPSKANMEKKVNAKEAEITDAVAKIRRQQLKEILAKQAELGVEVAEIPPSYLSDSEQRTDGRQLNNNKPFGKRDRFRNKKFDKRGKFNRNDRFSKRQRFENSSSANPQNQSDRFTKNQRPANGSETKKEPSLLKKLLSSEIKKDKKHLLQVFRFMAMNSFFESSPDRPLKYPLVIVKESGDEGKILDEIPEVMKDDTCASTGLENNMDCTQNVDISIREYADDGDEDEILKEDGEIIE